MRLQAIEVESGRAGATDVSALPALEGASWQPMRKRLLLDLGTLLNDDGSALVPDNIEAVSWGPPSAAGRPKASRRCAARATIGTGRPANPSGLRQSLPESRAARDWS